MAEEQKSKIGSVIATVVLVVVCVAGGWIGGGFYTGYRISKAARMMAAHTNRPMPMPVRLPSLTS